MKRILVSIVLAAVLLGAAGLGLVAMAKHKPQPRRAPARNRAVRVQAPPVQVIINKRVEIVGYGAAQPRTRLEIAPRVTGQIVYTSDAFRSGRMVRGPSKDDPKGEVLFRIDPEPFQLAVENAREGISLLEAQLASLEQEHKNLQSTYKLLEEMTQLEKQQLERVQSLHKRGVGTINEVDVARAKYLTTRNQLQATQNERQMIPRRKSVLEAQLQAARVKHRQAKLDLEYATYRCPVTGRIIRADAELGEQVQAGQTCGELYGTERMEIPVSIPAGEIRWLDPAALKACSEQNPNPEGGNTIDALVSWSIPGGRTLEWTGTVERIEAGVQAQTRTAGLIVCVDNTQQDDRRQDDFFQLDMNMYCKVTILGRVIPKAYIIPRGAVQPDGTVWIAQPKKDDTSKYRLEKRKIEIARFTDNQAMILPDGGLKQDDRVLPQAPPKAVIGMELDVQGTTPTTTPATAPTVNGNKE
ncbi:MAG: HlyD family efflux transporter periplasmic adaptor subunit [Phycisphaerae bacterium]|nr:HlyD family efflux transporter periplasmic adaptor subunit [Phycisphaerae bacterium]